MYIHIHVDRKFGSFHRQYGFSHCNTLQHTATHRNTLQHKHPTLFIDNTAFFIENTALLKEGRVRFHATHLK